MKATGIVLRVDDLGRVVVPKELCRILGIERHDPIEIYLDGDTIVLQKYHENCVFCGAESQVMIEYRGKRVCDRCVEAMSQTNPV